MSVVEIQHNMISLEGKVVKIGFFPENLKQQDDGSYWCNTSVAGVTIPQELGQKWFAKRPYKHPKEMYVLVGTGEMVNQYGAVSKGVILTPVGRLLKEHGLGRSFEYTW
jgi:hypothetical protein